MISIVVVHWNTPELLRACLASIVAAHVPVLSELVVVDCASDSGAIDRIVAEFAGARLIELERNDGYAAGCNAGARATSAEIVAFLNADTAVMPGALEAIDACFGLNPRIGLVAPLLLNPDRSIQSGGYKFPGVMNVACDLLPIPDRIRASRLNGRVDPGNLFHPYAIDYALGAALAVRAAALDQIGGWDESFGMYSEEVDLARQLAETGWMRLIEPRARIVHHGGAATSQRPRKMQAALWHSRGRYHRRWSSANTRLGIQAILNVAALVAPAAKERIHTARAAFANGLGH